MERDTAIGDSHVQTLNSLQTYLPASADRRVASINLNLAGAGGQQ